jgi:hypothetical protein
LDLAYEDSAYVLYEALKKEKSSLLDKMSIEEYEEKLKILQKLSVKEREEGKF